MQQNRFVCHLITTLIFTLSHSVSIIALSGNTVKNPNVHVTLGNIQL